eukprot:5043239-Alexandrium_andersonii.AAC.1
MGHPPTSNHPVGAQSWHQALPRGSASPSPSGLLSTHLGCIAAQRRHLWGRVSRSSAPRPLET